MIPQRMFSNEPSGSALKERVTACRKRLRENRVTFRAQAAMGVEELLPEARLPRSTFEDGELRESSALPQVVDQEVGIT